MSSNAASIFLCRQFYLVIAKLGKDISKFYSVNNHPMCFGSIMVVKLGVETKLWSRQKFNSQGYSIHTYIFHTYKQPFI